MHLLNPEEQAVLSITLPGNDIVEAVLVSVSPTHDENKDCITLSETLETISELSELRIFLCRSYISCVSLLFNVILTLKGL